MRLLPPEMRRPIKHCCAGAGTQILQFEAVAATSGTFARPPAMVSLMMQPEVMGLSAGGTFVVSRAALSAEEMALPAVLPPRSCPADCSGTGVCDVMTGACICRPGAAGDDSRGKNAVSPLPILVGK